VGELKARRRAITEEVEREEGVGGKG